MIYAIEMYFDKATEEKIMDIARKVADAGISTSIITNIIFANFLALVISLQSPHNLISRPIIMAFKETGDEETENRPLSPTVSSYSFLISKDRCGIWQYPPGFLSKYFW